MRGHPPTRRPLSSEYGTHKRVKTRFWPWGEVVFYEPGTYVRRSDGVARIRISEAPMYTLHYSGRGAGPYRNGPAAGENACHLCRLRTTHQCSEAGRGTISGRNLCRLKITHQCLKTGGMTWPSMTRKGRASHTHALTRALSLSHSRTRAQSTMERRLGLKYWGVKQPT